MKWRWHVGDPAKHVIARIATILLERSSLLPSGAHILYWRLALSCNNVLVPLLVAPPYLDPPIDDLRLTSYRRINTICNTGKKGWQTMKRDGVQ